MRKLRLIALILAMMVLCSCSGNKETQSTASNPASNVAGSADPAGSSESADTSATTPAPTDTPTPTPTFTPTPTPTPTEILVSFIGDTTLGEQRSHAGEWYCFTSVVGDNYSYPFSKSVEYLANDDMTLCNLEGPLTKSNNLRPDREIYLKGDPKYVQVLKEASIECCNLSNNHAYDYMDEGLNETRDVLDAAGIKWSDSDYYAIYEVKGVKIGMAGFNFTYERQPYYNAIDWLREHGCNIVVISCHIGVERMYEPEDSAIELAHDIIDYGADIYVGSHPHRLQPVEYYHNKYIIYSESNFCFGGQPWLSDPDTAIFQCTFTVDEGHVVGSRMVCIPFSMRSSDEGNDYCPKPYEPGTEEYARVMRKLRWSDENE
ncbi:MAG: CapA family protein [Clostridiales bacterium]|nr:CapA family protein [Clostridiales bacterium]